MTEQVVNPGAPVDGANPGAAEKVEVVNKEVVENVLNKPAEGEVKSWIADDWREKLANGDQKELQRLQRFSDVGQIFKSFRELEGMQSRGELKRDVDTSKLDEKQLADYRKSIGVPDKPEEYDLGLPQGMVLSDEDEIILGSVLETMHGQNRKPAEVKEAVGAFLEAREAQRAEWLEHQKHARVETEEGLRQEWGGNYLTNIGAVKNFLSSLPSGLGDLLATARLADGSVLGNNKEALMALAQVATELNPAGTMVPGGGTDQLKSITDEKAELEVLMKKDMNAWRKNGPARARHLELIDAELKLKARGH